MFKGGEMARVTAIRVGRRQGECVNVFLDSRFAFSLEAEVAVMESLQVGRELSDSQVEALARSDRFRRCLDAATRYLSYRPRSEAELRGRLWRRGFDGNSVEAVLQRLKEQGLVDDLAFAQFWRDNREHFSPRSQWLTQRELKAKGVADDIIGQVTDAADDDDSAYRAAAGKLRSLSQTDYQGFHRRLGSYLRRHGFSYEVIGRTVKRIWYEQREQH